MPIKAGLAGLVRHVHWHDVAGRRQAALAQSRSGSDYFASVLDFGGVGVAVCTDGIGTKALIAQMMGRYDTVGIDCVAMNVNDLICVGAQPITLVDYIAVEHAEPVDAGGAWRRASPRARGKPASPYAGGEIAAMRDVIKGAKYRTHGVRSGGHGRRSRVALDAVNTGAACAAGATASSASPAAASTATD